MKLPLSPPPLQELLDQAQKLGKLGLVLDFIQTGSSAEDSYLHWDQLRHRTPPKGLDHQLWWLSLKLSRSPLLKKAEIRDKTGEPFQYALTDEMVDLLHFIDLGAGGSISMPDAITNPETRDRYFVSSLIEEAITSSQLEGAATTRRVAAEMLRNSRPPRNRHERMIFNNFQTMREISAVKNQELTPELVFAIHRMVTEGAFPDDSAAGRFRRNDEKIFVGDGHGNVLHDPPDAQELPARLKAMCDFANGNTPAGFIHPVIRSIMLHFQVGYDHPFVDGNGRTARALFYWSMLFHNYWLFEYVSISTILRKAPARYMRSFLYTETDSNDLTYFLLFQLKVIRQAIAELHAHLDRKTSQIKTLERMMRGDNSLNLRQRALLAHALRHPHHHYTFTSHQVSHNIVYQTARTDLLKLSEMGLLEKYQAGRKMYFMPHPNLEQILSKNT